jgi:hypothetical protein
MTDLVAAIRRRLEFCATDLGDDISPPVRPGKPVDPTLIACDEEALGFVLPPTLKLLYSTIGNGGFGPGYGLIGLTSGEPDNGTAVQIYQRLRSASADLPWPWPIGLLPICAWGRGAHSCIDCTSPAYAMRLVDPNVADNEEPLFDEAMSFDGWIAAWADGVDLWERLYRKGGLLERQFAARHN